MPTAECPPHQQPHTPALRQSVWRTPSPACSYHVLRAHPPAAEPSHLHLCTVQPHHACSSCPGAAPSRRRARARGARTARHAEMDPGAGQRGHRRHRAAHLLHHHALGRGHACDHHVACLRRRAARRRVRARAAAAARPDAYCVRA